MQELFPKVVLHVIPIASASHLRSPFLGPSSGPGGAVRGDGHGGEQRARDEVRDGRAEDHAAVSAHLSARRERNNVRARFVLL